WFYVDDANDAVRGERPPWRQRFTRDVLRFDNNGWGINFIGHPLSGAAYYGFPRANGMSMPASAFYAVGASFLWEFVAELQDKISLNDLITTPLSGIALGEFFSRLARYLNSAPAGGNRVQRAFGWTIGFSQALHDAMDDAPKLGEDIEVDNLGYDASIAHRFEWRGGAAVARTNAAESFGLAEVIFDGRLVAIPGYLRPGRSVAFFGDADVTRMRMRMSGGPDGRGFDMEADTILFGMHAQDVRLDGSGGHRGGAIIVGTSLGYQYRREAFDSYNDRIGTTRLPGLAVDIDTLLGRGALFLGGRLQADFAGIRAESFPAWQAAHPDERAKTILEREGYYYGFGLSSSLVVRFELPWLAVEGRLAHARYESKEGFDRDQESVTFDVAATDRILEAELAIRVGLVPRKGVFLELGATRRDRRSGVGEFELERRLETVYSRIGQVF
ncbi:MAG: DUF3943 domain-containing protein, partial [Polyangiaceae bacterium]|nr:DUF3943 domain-containing protein [Polyangiaceae bacterium]